MSAVTNHQDDVGVHPIDHMLPTDPVMTQDGVVVVLDAATRVRSSSAEGIIHPLTGQLPGDNRRVEADDLDLVSTRKGWGVAGPWLRVNMVTVVTMLSLNLVDAAYRRLLGGRGDFHHQLYYPTCDNRVAVELLILS